MRRTLSLAAVISIIILSWSLARAVDRKAPVTMSEATKQTVFKAYGKLPLSFEVNRGQTDAPVEFLSRGRGYTLFLTPTEAVLSLRRVAVLRIQLIGGNQNPKILGVEKLPGESHYFIGNHSTKWITDVPMYAKVQYEEIYPGIDLVYYGAQGKLEYDFIVEPGTDPKVITLAFAHIDKLQIDTQGDLVIQTTGGEVRWHKPVVYQNVDGIRKSVAGSYVLRGGYQVGFQVAGYDLTRPLIIDPVFSYSTHLGGTADDAGFGIAVDALGNAYVTGHTFSSDFPGTANTPAGAGDAFVTKLDPTGTMLVYSTYLGGSGFDGGRGIAVDSERNAYVIGKTNSIDFPTSGGAFQTLYGGGPFDVFVTKLDAAGSALEYSTFLGGSGPGDESGNNIAVDASGNIYVVGFTDSTDFPTTGSAFQPGIGSGPPDAFVTKLNPDPAGPTPDPDDLVYSTYLGGNNQDFGRGIAVDSSGNAYVTGDTISTNFPPMPVSIGPGGGQQAFVTKLNPTGSAPLVYSTSLGGTGRDFGLHIALESGCAMDCNAYVMGKTNSVDFFTTPGSFDTNCGTVASPCDNITLVFDVFLTKLNDVGSAAIYSTYLGGSGSENFGGDDSGSLAVDASGNIYVTGETDSLDFPTANPLQPASDDGQDAFVTKLNPDPTGPTPDPDDLVYSTYLGGTGQDGSSRRDVGIGIALDTVGNVYVTGLTLADNFPTKNPLQTSRAGGSDAFVAKISEVLEVGIDIKPGSDPNSIQLGSEGNVPVAIFSTPEFDATTVDPPTVTLASAPVKLKGNGTSQSSFEDIDGDGLLDQVVHVDTTALELSDTDEEAILKGETTDGVQIQGGDTVRVIE